MMMMMNWLGLFQEAENGSTAADSGSGQPCENLGLLCEWLFEATGNEQLSEILSWLIGTPLKVMIIVAAALVINNIPSKPKPMIKTRPILDSKPVRFKASAPPSNSGNSEPSFLSIIEKST